MQPAGSNMADGVGKRSFGTVSVGKKAPVKTFVIRNTGNAPLTGLGITKTGAHAGDFTIGTLPKTSLAAGASLEFKVTFKPVKKGIRNAAIRIRSNDADENPFDIKLTGTGGK